MKVLQFTLTYLAAGLIICVAQGALAQPSAGTADANSIVSRFPSGSIKSVEMADTALADAKKERAEIEARFAQEEQACHPKFFASSCVDEAKERRRRAMLKLRPVEIEANTFKRQARVTSRDEALEKRRQKDADAGIDRDAPSTPPSMDAEAVPPADADTRAGRKPPKNSGVDRAARHEEKLKRSSEEENAEEAQRARNEADYEKKVKAAEARQQEIAKRKAEKYQKIEEKRKLKETTMPSVGPSPAPSTQAAPSGPAASSTPQAPAAPAVTGVSK